MLERCRIVRDMPSENNACAIPVSLTDQRISFANAETPADFIAELIALCI